MGILYIILICFLLLAFPYARYFVCHPITCIGGACTDIYRHFHFKKSNLCPYYGQIYMFVASGSRAFGSGKTLSMVEWLRMVYHRYNGLTVYDEEAKEFVTQHVIVISNVKLNDIPYIPFRGRDQFVNIDKLDHGKMDILVFAIDEAGAEFNSRNYKENLPPSFMQRFLQVRHNKVCVCMTCQRFQFLDKMLRNVTGIVTTCRKRWRIVRLQEYDAFSLENAVNPEMIQPLCTKWYYATDKLYKSYDTLYNVEKLKEQLDSGDFLNTAEILESIKNDGSIENVRNRVRRAYRTRK